MFKYVIIGFLLATIIPTVVNGICDIFSALVELIKGAINVRIIKYNNIITESSNRVIGFAINSEEDEDNNDY